MTKEVIISISGLPTDMDEDDCEAVEVISFGNYYLKNGKHYVKYEEVKEQQNKVTSSILKFTDEKVELKRYGGLSAQMEFEAGVKYVTCYHTDYGDVTIGFATNEIEIHEEEELIEIRLDYNLELNEEDAGRCNVIIKIVPQGKEFRLRK